ncbi:MAG: ABC transporter ATP-binding protein, partial [Pelagibacteraceae bacterium]
MIITGASTAAVAWLLDPAIKKIFVEKDSTMLVIIPVGIIFAFLAKSISLYITRVKSIDISFKIKQSIQINLAEKILNSDTSYISDRHSGKFMANFTADTQILQSVTQTVALNAVKEFITLIFLMSLMFSKDTYLSMVALIIIPIAALLSKKLGKRMGKAARGSLEANEEFTKHLSEILKSTLLIKIFQQEKNELINLSNKIKNWITKAMRVEKTRLGSAPVMESLTGFAVAAVVFAGGLRSINGDLEVGAFFSFLTALMLAYQPVRALAGLNIGLNEGFTAATRIYKILDTQNYIKDKIDAKELNLSNGDIEFKNVTMEYKKGIPIIKNINLKFGGNSRSALVGLSGGGKSTILNLIPRFFNIQKGEITIDNQNISDVKVSSLRRHIALVSQDIILFDDTIKNN